MVAGEAMWMHHETVDDESCLTCEKFDDGEQVDGYVEYAVGMMARCASRELLTLPSILRRFAFDPLELADLESRFGLQAKEHNSEPYWDEEVFTSALAKILLNGTVTAESARILFSSALYLATYPFPSG